ncbi:RIP metalloprotease RseP [Metallumcola ferriviriculae]|uniref:Zinc metalloprotease n=1 Tax=Metallumcola ferriviriculae TaxID=3039180 RepID=A0AAU0UMA1_9FIRM|nr:RIP metalloprotease RseP [Desulfitibacteraceae bacterium MK1]
MTLLATVIIFGLLIFIHELGHFIVAKRAGVYVEEFSLGMGPKIVSRQKGETLYSLRALPIGGFVRMGGMESDLEVPEGQGFNDKTVLARMSVIFAGPLMNFILAVILFVVVFMVLGVPSDANVVGRVLPDKPAAEAGLMAGDRITAVDGQKVTNWMDLVRIIHNKADQEISLSIVRNGDEREFTAVPQLDPEYNVGLIGIEQSWERHGLFGAIWLGLEQSYEITKLILVGFIQTFTGQIEAEVSGPVGIYSLVGQAMKFGFGTLLNFTALLSLNLGLINLFPIPALDGSRLVFLGFEGLRGRPLDPDKENMIHLIGFALLMMLIIVITYNDIAKLLG